MPKHKAHEVSRSRIVANDCNWDTGFLPLVLLLLFFGTTIGLYRLACKFYFYSIAVLCKIGLFSEFISQVRYLQAFIMWPICQHWKHLFTLLCSRSRQTTSPIPHVFKPKAIKALLNSISWCSVHRTNLMLTLPPDKVVLGDSTDSELRSAVCLS